jgi:hypothetical protein
MRPQIIDNVGGIKCCICKHPIPLNGTWAFGNNAWPVVASGRCCDDCNAQVVLPARILDHLASPNRT